MPSTVEFVLRDAEGKEHRYETVLHPATEGQRIMWRLVAIGAEPIGRLAAGLLADGGIRSLRSLLDADVAGVSQRVDLARMGADLRAAITATDPETLGREVLSKTTRDGKPLEQRGAFDAAYTANYGELLQALWRVIGANRFLPLPATS